MSDKDKNPVEALNALPGTLRPMGAAAPDIDPMAQPLWEIDERFINPFAPVPPVQTWAIMGGRPALPCSGIITFSAKPKQGKSLSVYALLTSVLSGQEFDTLKPTERRPRLAVVFDIEMSLTTLSNRAKAMQKSLGDAAPRFQVVSLLSTPKSERLKVIEEITDKFNPDIVAIDQVARLVTNFNDPSENIDFGEWLTQYAKSRTVLTVIHQNKAADNSQMKGHLGSILEELAEENYSVSHKQGVFEIRPVNARQSCVDDAAPMTFALNDAGEIITATNVIELNREKEAEDWRKDFRIIFGDDEELRHSEIKARIMKRQGLTERPAETKISNARAAGAIAHVDPNDNRSPYRITKAAAADFEDIENNDL